MRRFTTAAAAIALLALGGCAPPGSTASPTPTDVANEALTTIKGACTAGAPTFNALPQALPNASASTRATVQNIETYYNSACASESAMQAVIAASPQGTDQTAQWIGALSAGVVAALPTIATLIH